MTILSDTTTLSLATLNPFLYRSYLYDSETGLYYLQSRYYDPEIGRFINADESEVIWLSGSKEHHLYAYCFNDYFNRIDPAGAVSTSYKKELIFWGVTVDLGDGWFYRIDGKNTFAEHVHLYNKNKKGDITRKIKIVQFMISTIMGLEMDLHQNRRKN